MVHVRQGSGGFAVSTGGSTCFWPAGMSYLAGTIITTESQAQVTYRTAGVMSNAFVQCTAFTSSGSVTLRDNGTSQTLTAPVSGTGVSEDTTHTFSVTAGDKINYQTTGNYTLMILGNTFSATTNTAIRMLACNNGTNITYSTAGGTGYNPIGGGYLSLDNVDTAAQTTIRAAGTLANGIVNVITNSGSSSGPIVSRKNGANGNISISVTATTTGIFEDTTHTDSVVSGDLVNFQVSEGATSPNWAYSLVGCDYSTTLGNVPNIHMDPNVGDQTINASTNAFFQMGAGYQTTESQGQIKTRDTFTYSNMETYVNGNTVTGTSTVMFRANTANTSLTFTITGSGTGFFSDTTHTYVAAATDLVVIELSTGSGGTSLGPSSFTAWASLHIPVLYTRTITETVGHGNYITGSG